MKSINHESDLEVIKVDIKRLNCLKERNELVIHKIGKPQYHISQEVIVRFTDGTSFLDKICVISNMHYSECDGDTEYILRPYE